MFGGSRRHRPPVQPLTKETANPNAATAAASAFMRRERSTSLSSAAAAAALKARPVTPTNVADTPTKRSQRRSASVSSTGSRDRGRRELQRTPSTGSMSERTFRSPSPGRSPAPNSRDIPPVPKVPDHKQYKTDNDKSTHTRSVSLQTQPFRTASQKMKGGNGAGQGSWFGAAATGDMHNVRHSTIAVETRPADDLRPGSPSINFSYPRSRFDSPLEYPDQTLVYDANSRRMVPRYDLMQREHDIRKASEKPVKRKKSGAKRSGSHLMKGTVARTKGTAVGISSLAAIEQSQPREEPAPRRDPSPEPRNESPISREQTLDGSDRDEPIKAESNSENHTTVLSPQETLNSPNLGTGIAPPVMRERPELKNEEDEDLRKEIEPIPANTFAVAPHPVSPPCAPLSQQAQYEEPEPVKPTTNEAVEVVAMAQTKSPRRTRVHSESPVRTTHFAPTTNHLLIRHEPPPRSLSPIKSALKQRSPTRSASPSDDGSELSSVGHVTKSQDDSGVSRKKSVRVSFDDRNTKVVGESAEPWESDSPVLASPQTRKSWHNLVARTKKDSVSIDEHERMTPRPALPSFGSVREKKSRETEERPLVRPLDSLDRPITTPPRQSSPSLRLTLGQSSDAVAGSILFQESSRNAANISKYREPLPPVVTSVDGTGYESNTSSTSDDENETESTPQISASTYTHSEPNEDNGGPSKASTNAARQDPRENDGTYNKTNGNVPTISIIQPSPRMHDEDKDSPQQEYFEVPSEDPNETSAGSSIVPVVDKAQPTTPPRSPEPISATGSPMHDIKEEEGEDSDGSSIYSDAYEDLSEFEGDGFMSLDAVLESPANPKVSKKLVGMALSMSKDATEPAKTDQSSVMGGPPQKEDDWEAAKVYWRSLNPEKRRQLELEAEEEAAEEADAEGSRQQKAKVKKHKSADHHPPASEPTSDPFRTYQTQLGTKWTLGHSSTTTTAAPKVNGNTKFRISMRGEQAATASPNNASTSGGGMRRSMRSDMASSPDSREGRLRKSLRSEPDSPVAGSTSMRSSMRSNGNVPETRDSMRKGTRPTSYSGIPGTPSTTTVSTVAAKRNSSAEPVSRLTKTSLRRQGSDSSESSFRRARPGGGEGFGFRKTMRSSARDPAPPPPESVRGSGRFSLRSLSPTGSAFRRNSNTSSPPPMAGGGRMRNSLRRPQSSDDTSSRLSFASFGRSSGKKPGKSSRFADSSDEEDTPRRYNSRFADSSDEDDVLPARTKDNSMPKSMRTSSSAAASAMGVLAPRGGNESPDLPDSDDEHVLAQQNGHLVNGNGHKAKPGLSRSGSGRHNIGRTPSSQALDLQAMPSPRARRGSFLSILRRKKDPASKISRSTGESAARRDTPLERSTEQLAMIRSNSNGHSGRLQKPDPNWPLPEPEQEEVKAAPAKVQRPSTAGGPPPSNKPGFLGRRSMSQQERTPTVAMSDASGDRITKKKKFGALRKMFRLAD